MDSILRLALIAEDGVGQPVARLKVLVGQQLECGDPPGIGLIQTSFGQHPLCSRHRASSYLHIH